LLTAFKDEPALFAEAKIQQDEPAFFRRIYPASAGRHHAAVAGVRQIRPEVKHFLFLAVIRSST
jgi:hypothetical protein